MQHCTDFFSNLLQIYQFFSERLNIPVKIYRFYTGKKIIKITQRLYKTSTAHLTVYRTAINPMKKYEEREYLVFNQFFNYCLCYRRSRSMTIHS